MHYFLKVLPTVFKEVSETIRTLRKDVENDKKIQHIYSKS